MSRGELAPPPPTTLSGFGDICIREDWVRKEGAPSDRWNGRWAEDTVTAGTTKGVPELEAPFFEPGGRGLVQGDDDNNKKMIIDSLLEENRALIQALRTHANQATDRRAKYDKLSWEKYCDMRNLEHRCNKYQAHLDETKYEYKRMATILTNIYGDRWVPFVEGETNDLPTRADEKRTGKRVRVRLHSP